MVMSINLGLSSYGDAKYCEELSNIITKTKNGFELNLNYFLHHKEKYLKLMNMVSLFIKIYTLRNFKKLLVMKEKLTKKSTNFI